MFRLGLYKEIILLPIIPLESSFPFFVYSAYQAIFVRKMIHVREFISCYGDIPVLGKAIVLTYFKKYMTMFS